MSIRVGLAATADKRGDTSILIISTALVATMNTHVHDLLMLYRPMSQMLAFKIVPDVDRRLASSILRAQDLPLSVARFQILMTPAREEVQINQEVKILADTVPQRPVQAGEPLTIADIDPDHTFLVPPELDGVRAAFYLVQSFFLTVMGFFDFTPNAPDGPSPGKMRYPVVDIANAIGANDRLKPDDALKNLQKHDWPPGRLLFPNVLLAVHAGTVPGSPEFVTQVDRAYSREVWSVWCEFLGTNKRVSQSTTLRPSCS